VTNWLTLLKQGDAQAAQGLWDRYFPQLVRLARKRLAGVPRRVADEEDVALSAFDSFCRGAEAGRFPQLADRTDLWKLLVVITARKAADLAARERRLRRGGGKVRGDSALLGSLDGEEPGRGVDQIIGPEPTPDFAAEVAEQCQILLAALDDNDLRSLAVWKMEGYTNQEIAEKIARDVSTVERKLRLIRHTWESLRQAQEDVAE
jgi:DNA-directed RNA polymerase specialized sigma24 family protein